MIRNAFLSISFLSVISAIQLYLKRNVSAPPVQSPVLGEPIPYMDVDETLAAATLFWGHHSIGTDNYSQFANDAPHVVVAVIDTGCDIYHPALQNQVWTNQGESGLNENGEDRATNGIDDDQNGWVDDVHGWNFVSRDPGIMDDHGHGTHISGIIARAAPNAKLMVLKYYSPENSGRDNLNFTVEAIRYAVKMKAQIINYSGGGVLRSREEEAALNWAAQNGVLVVAAAGNEGVNSDFYPFYPANYGLPNIVAVTAVDRHGALLPTSNFGRSTVDIAAPGKNIYSTLPGGQYGYLTGTSQATAFVSGVAALFMAIDPELNDFHATKTWLLGHGRPTLSLKGQTRTESIVSAN